jgi:hypothetical protein
VGQQPVRELNLLEKDCYILSSDLMSLALASLGRLYVLYIYNSVLRAVLSNGQRLDAMDTI